MSAAWSAGFQCVLKVTAAPESFTAEMNGVHSVTGCAARGVDRIDADDLQPSWGAASWQYCEMVWP